MFARGIFRMGVETRSFVTGAAFGVARSFSGRRWVLRETDTVAVLAIARAANISETLARLLLTRGIGASDAKDFLKRSLAGAHLNEAVFVQRAKACRSRQLFHDALILTSPADRFADTVINDKQF